MKDNEKPSLQDLFSSKRLEMPDEHFWDSFQNDVKGKAIAGSNRKPKIFQSKVILAALPILAFTIFFSRPLFNLNPELASVDVLNIELAENRNGQISPSLSILQEIMDSDVAIQSGFNRSSSKVGNASAFANTRLSVSAGSDVFAQHNYQSTEDFEFSVSDSYTF
jgi:hypothetical protein